MLFFTLVKNYAALVVSIGTSFTSRVVTQSRLCCAFRGECKTRANAPPTPGLQYRP